MRKSSLKTLMIASLIAVTFSAGYSQTPGGEADDPGLPDGGSDIDGPEVPLDGGVVILMAAGAAYGYAKLKDKKQKNAD